MTNSFCIRSAGLATLGLLILVLTAPVRAADEKPKVDRFGDELPAGAIARLGTIRWRSREANRVLFSPDGLHLATLSSDNRVTLWQLSTGKPVRHLVCAKNPYCCAFSSDGELLAVGCRGGRIDLFNTGTGTLRSSFDHPDTDTGDSVGQLGIAPDGKSIVDITRINRPFKRGLQIGRWEISTRRFSDELTDNFNQEFPDDLHVSFSSGSSRIAFLRPDKIEVFDWDSHKWISRVPFLNQSLLPRHLLSADGKLLITSSFVPASAQYEVQVWNADNGLHVRNMKWGSQTPAAAVRLVLSHDQRILVSRIHDRLIVWDFASGEFLRAIPFPGQFGGNGEIALSKDGSILAAIHMGNRVRLWNTQDGRPLSELTEGHDSFIRSLTWTHDGNRIVSADLLGKLLEWDVSTARQRNSIQESVGDMHIVELTPDNQSLVLAGLYQDPSNGKLSYAVQFFNFPKRKLIEQLTVGSSPTAMALSPDGRTLALGAGEVSILRESRDFTTIDISLWDLDTRRQLGTLRGHEERIESLRFSVDGTTLASASADGSFRRWNVAQRRLVSARILRDLRPQEADRRFMEPLPLQSAAFSPDLQTVLFVDYRTGKLIIRGLQQDRPTSINQQLTLDVKGDPNANVCISPDGSTAAVTCCDPLRHTSTVTLINIVTGKPVAQFAGADDGFRIMKFSADGRRLACGSQLGTILIYKLPAGIPGNE